MIQNSIPFSFSNNACDNDCVMETYIIKQTLSQYSKVTTVQASWLQRVSISSITKKPYMSFIFKERYKETHCSHLHQERVVRILWYCLS